MKAGVQIRMTLGAKHHLLLSSQLFLNPRLHEAATTLGASATVQFIAEEVSAI
jgi:hypothetical protein